MKATVCIFHINGGYTHFSKKFAFRNEFKWLPVNISPIVHSLSKVDRMRVACERLVFSFNCLQLRSYLP